MVRTLRFDRTNAGSTPAPGVAGGLSLARMSPVRLFKGVGFRPHTPAWSNGRTSDSKSESVGSAPTAGDKSCPFFDNRMCYNSTNDTVFKPCQIIRKGVRAMSSYNGGMGPADYRAIMGGNNNSGWG